MTPSRRSFLTGLAATIITAPAIVRVGSLMPVKVMGVSPYWEGATLYGGVAIKPIRIAPDFQMFVHQRLVEICLNSELAAFNAYSSGSIYTPRSNRVITTR